jgi:hypothetical protein
MGCSWSVFHFQAAPQPNFQQSYAFTPAQRLDIVLKHAFTTGIHVTNIVLRFDDALFGGSTIPSRGFGIVLRDAVAQVIHQAKIELSYRIPVFGAEHEIAESPFVLGILKGLKARLAICHCRQA